VKSESVVHRKSGKIYINDEFFVIPDEEEYILYAPLEKKVLVINKAAVNFLQDIKKGKVDSLNTGSSFAKQLIQAGVITTDKKPVKRIAFPSKQKDFDPAGVSLFLTTHCSMRCIYCYANGGDSSKTMPWSTAKAAIDWIVNHIKKRNRKNFYVSFHGGGEVTVAGALMKKCVEYLKKITKTQNLEARTEAGLNGIMNESMVDWVVDNLNGATLSLDGIRNVQNRQRPLRNNKESFDYVVATLKRMDLKGFKYSIRTTVTNESLGKLAESVEFMSKNFSAKVIQVEPVFLAGRALTNNLDSVEPGEFVEQFRKARKVADSHGKVLRYSGARFGKITNTFCKANGNSFAVTPEGNVTSCYEVSDAEDPRADLFFFGKLGHKSGQFNFDYEKLKRLGSLTVENKPYCENCFCKWHCAGDCAAKLALSDNAWDPSLSKRCYINQQLTKDQIKEYLRNGGGNEE
jgi:uncharacterized protein